MFFNDKEIQEKSYEELLKNHSKLHKQKVEKTTKIFGFTY